MNSIEIAKKLIEKNDKDIEGFRNAEEIIRKRIAQYKQNIENLQGAIAMAEEDLQRMRDQKKECQVDNLALKVFIAAGGGQDMFD